MQEIHLIFIKKKVTFSSVFDIILFSDGSNKLNDINLPCKSM